MTDILKRLRNPPFGTETSERNLMTEAADEIERLRALTAPQLHQHGGGVETVKAELAAIRKSVRNAMGAIESNQVADKDAHGTLNGVLKHLDALVGGAKERKG